MITTVKRVLPVLITGIAIATPAFAQVADEAFQDWRTFSVVQDNAKTCYAASRPVNESGTFKKRGQPYVLIVQRDGGFEVNASPGYPVKEGTDVMLETGGKSFGLFARGEVAWAKTDEDDAALIAALKDGKELVVKANSARGSNSEDTYSLKGVTQALRHSEELCK